MPVPLQKPIVCRRDPRVRARTGRRSPQRPCSQARSHQSPPSVSSSGSAGAGDSLSIPFIRKGSAPLFSACSIASREARRRLTFSGRATPSAPSPLASDPAPAASRSSRTMPSAGALPHIGMIPLGRPSLRVRARILSSVIRNWGISIRLDSELGHDE